ncbi:hypothetical protein ACVDG3_06170 [Meridianimarinicoccus sp. RP-17]|uniref:hypothetical protein n=1 Tax=Meridianimarinicoccus zhengii TaxID=2056810 RepID=UPI000DAD9249|nr:hypothetical protein [Phycocomes zhengii]
MRVAWLTLVAALASAPMASSQSFEDAVRANVALAVTLCTNGMMSGSSASSLFGSSGFAYRAIDRGTNDHGVALGVDHFFDAPAETAKAEVMAADGPMGLCKVLTRHLGEDAVRQIVSNALWPEYAGAELRGPNEWIVRGAAELPLIITLRTIADNHRYEAPGTVEVSMAFPG